MKSRGMPFVAAAMALASALVVQDCRASLGGFVENLGQVDGAVRYYAHCGGMTVYFTAGGLVLDLQDGAPSAHVVRGDALPGSAMVAEPTRVSPARHACAVWVRFSDANPSAHVEGLGELPGGLNYFLGDDPGKWQRGVRAFEEVLYRDLWPGVDLAFRGGRGAVEYEVRRDPGARHEVDWTYEGAHAVRETGSGSVLVETLPGRLPGIVATRESGGGRFAWGRPEAAVGGEQRDNPWALLWSTFLGGALNEAADAVCLDAMKNAVIVGTTASSDFPTTPGAYDPTFNQDWETFVVKLSACGSALLWGTFLGGSEGDVAEALALDASGCPVIGGQTASEDFPVTPGAYDTELSGYGDIFLVKLSSQGDELLWGTFLGGSFGDGVAAIALSSCAGVVLAGLTNSADFPVTPGAYDVSYNGGYDDGIVAKLSSGGDRLLWATFLGGSDVENGWDVALDASGNPVVVGETNSEDFPTTPAAFDPYSHRYTDAFVTKLTAQGDDLVWSTYLGGRGGDSGHGIGLDASGSVVVAGHTYSLDFPTTPGAYDRSLEGTDAFVVKLTPCGSGLVWSTFLGGSEADGALGLALDSSGRPLVMGTTVSPDCPTTSGAFDDSYNGESDVFVARLSSCGSCLQWGSYLGASDRDQPTCITADPEGNAVLAGLTYCRDFPTTPAGYDTSFNGHARDAFVSKFHMGEPSAAAEVHSLFSGGLSLRVSNPFSTTAMISYALGKEAAVGLQVLDIQGRALCSWDAGRQAPGWHSIPWAGEGGYGREIPAGIYFVRMRAGQGESCFKIAIAR